jgi:hypothetical protein
MKEAARNSTPVQSLRPVICAYGCCGVRGHLNVSTSACNAVRGISARDFKKKGANTDSPRSLNDTARSCGFHNSLQLITAQPWHGNFLRNRKTRASGNPNWQEYIDTNRFFGTSARQATISIVPRHARVQSPHSASAARHARAIPTSAVYKFHAEYCTEHQNQRIIFSNSVERTCRWPPGPRRWTLLSAPTLVYVALRVLAAGHNSGW